MRDNAGFVRGRGGRLRSCLPMVAASFVICRDHRHSRSPSPLPRLLTGYTMWGYIDGMRNDIKKACAKRLNRIEGQVRGIARMVEDDRYCIDIVTQIAAVRAALRRLEEEVLRDHVAHCVEHAIASGNKADQRRKIEELMNVVGRAER